MNKKIDEKLKKIKEDKIEVDYSIIMKIKKSNDNQYFAVANLEEAEYLTLNIYGHSFNRELQLNLYVGLFKKKIGEEKIESKKIYECIFSQYGFQSTMTEVKEIIKDVGIFEGFHNVLSLELRKGLINERGNYEISIFNKDDNKIITSVPFNII